MTRVVEPPGAALDGGIIRAVKRQRIEARRLLRVLSYGPHVDREDGVVHVGAQQSLQTINSSMTITPPPTFPAPSTNCLALARHGRDAAQIKWPL
jgi:hypothetical protein